LRAQLTKLIDHLAQLDCRANTDHPNELLSQSVHTAGGAAAGTFHALRPAVDALHVVLYTAQRAAGLLQPLVQAAGIGTDAGVQAGDLSRHS
jgi:hypothetical protein